MNRFQAIVADAKTRISEISASEVKAKLDANASFCLVDVREMEEWNISHLPEALPLSKGILERDIELIIPDPDTEIVLYCGGGNRSALAADNLQKMGYTNVKSMIGGFKGWVNANYPLRKD